MKKNNFSRLFAALMFVAVLVLTGCKPDAPAKGSIYAHWTSSSGEHFEISKDAVKNYGDTWDSYSGNNVTVE